MRAIILTALIFSQNIFAQQVSTDVSSDADLQVLYVAKHPSKFLKCWGRPTDSRVDSYDGNDGASDQNQGSLSSDASGRRLHDITWNSNWTEEDEFKIQYKKNITETYSEHSNTTCTKKTWTYKVSRSESHMKTHVKLAVPESIWVVGLKPTYKSKSSVGVMRVSNTYVVQGDKLSVSKNDDLAIGKYTYQFVRPMDEISLEVEINDSGLKDEEVAAEIEVAYMGQSRCEKIIQTNGGYASSSLQGALQKAVNGEMAVEDFNQYLSCVSSPKHLNKVLYQNGPVDLQKLETNVSELGSHVSLSPIVMTVIMKAQFEIANKIMSDLNLLCEPTKEKNYAKLSNGVAKRGYVLASFQYQRMNALLALLNPEPYKQFSMAMDGAGKNFENYASLKQNSNMKSEVGNVAMMFQDRRLWVIQLLNGILTELPKTQVGGAERDAVQTNLMEIRSALILTNQLVQEQLNRIAKAEVNPIEANDLSKAAEALAVAKSNLESSLQKSGELYVYDNGFKAFNDYAMTFTDQFFAGMFDVLFTSHSGFLQEYLSTQVGVSKQEALKYVDSKRKEIAVCLTSLTVQ